MFSFSPFMLIAFETNNIHRWIEQGYIDIDFLLDDVSESHIRRKNEANRRMLNRSWGIELWVC